MDLESRSVTICARAVPRHVAIIMDGNRRWARLRGLSLERGHLQGVIALSRTVEAALKLGVQVLTVFGFSTENWQRPQSEITELLDLMSTAAQERREQMHEVGVRLSVIGNVTQLPAALQERLDASQQYTATSNALHLVLALNYGGRDEIRRACLAAAHDLQQGRLSAEELSEERFASYLDTARFPEPELLIRTSGEYRLSNFLLWQLSYSEMVFIDRLWPDFDEEAFCECIETFQTRLRKFGV